jgi:glutamate formiminotransferase
VFKQIQKIAQTFGTNTNGSELIGLLPEKALQHPEMTLGEAIEYLGLNAVEKFNINERIIEYQLHIKSELKQS